MSPVQPIRLAPDSVQDFTDTFHAELCGDGMWGVVQVTRWLCRDGETWDQEACDLDYGLTEDEARETVARLTGEVPAKRRAA